MDFGNILSTAWKTIWKHKVIIWFGLAMVILPALLGILIGGVFAFSTPESIEVFFTSSFDENLFLLFVILAYIAFMLFRTYARRIWTDGDLSCCRR